MKPFFDRQPISRGCASSLGVVATIWYAVLVFGSFRVAALISSEKSHLLDLYLNNLLVDAGLDDGLDTAAAGRRIAAMTEKEKNAVKEYVGMCGGVLFVHSFFFRVRLGGNRLEAVPVELLQLPKLQVYFLSLPVCYLLYLRSLFTNRLSLHSNQITAVPPWLTKMTQLRM
jgi:hypothetical protein